MSAEKRLFAQGRVRWKRFAVIILPAAAIAAILIGLTAEGAIAANISVSGQQFLVTASSLNGTGFEQFGGQVTSSTAGTQPVIVSAIRSATLASLCQQVTVGPLSLRLTAGGGTTPVSASNLIVDASSLAGSSATFHNIVIGQDAGTLTQDPGTAGTTGGFGEQASSVTIENLVQHTWLTTAGTFTLPGLSLGFGGSCP
ncbi:MAG: cholesterol esterase [Streptosporangiaceae bacterium]|nr:cholesterol esterase [Streptosporangiaceae bacterium]MBV9856344.1 cholesterol esterase [Streptosporangiaceae bacterium]